MSLTLTGNLLFMADLLASSVIGTFSAGYLADKFGRKPILLVSIALSFVAIAIEFIATTPATFFGGKFLNGFLAGVILSVAVTYVGEVRFQALSISAIPLIMYVAIY